MKNLFTFILAAFLSTSFALAQNFLVIVGVEKDTEDKYSMESFTNNLGFGYVVNDKITVGLTMTDATSDSVSVSGKDIVTKTAAEMQVFARYYHTENIFLSLTTPWTSSLDGISPTDLARIGGGYSMEVWQGINAEAGYSMLISSDVNSDNKGELKIGISKRF